MGMVFLLRNLQWKAKLQMQKNNMPHRSLALSFSYKGRTKLIPIKKEQIPGIKARMNDYKELKAAIDELTRINAELLRSE